MGEEVHGEAAVFPDVVAVPGAGPVVSMEKSAVSAEVTDSPDVPRESTTAARQCD